MLKSGTAQIQLTGSSSYGRPVATVSVDGDDLGEQLISQGLAVPVTRYITNDPRRASRYQPAFADPQRAGRGAFAGRYLDPEK